MTTPAFHSGTGRRKTAIARVRLLPGEGEIVVNGRSLEEHFGNAINEADVKMPFRVTGTEGRFNAMIKVEGGGVTGQAGAGLPHARSAHEGTQEVRAQARSQGPAVHQALVRAAHLAADRRFAPCGRSLTDTEVRSLASSGAPCARLAICAARQFAQGNSPCCDKLTGADA
jgi:small subunit ribosomal protein S9